MIKEMKLIKIKLTKLIILNKKVNLKALKINLVLKKCFIEEI